MKKILTFLILAAIPLTVCGQFNPPPTGAFTYSGSSWVAAVTSATGGALGFTPPPAALYCYNSTSGQWVPFDASCQVGGAGVYLPLSGGTLTGPLYGTSATFSGTVAVSDLIPKNSPYIDVRAYGAKGDGVTDDRAAIQAAATAAVAGQTLYFPAGYTFFINSTPSGSPSGLITVPIGVNIAGFGTVRLGTITNSLPVFAVEGGDLSPTTFENITIDLNGLGNPINASGNYGHGGFTVSPTLTRSGQITFFNLTMENGNSTGSLTTNTTNNVTVQNCHWVNWGVGGTYRQDSSLTYLAGRNIKVIGNDFSALGILPAPVAPAGTVGTAGSLAAGTYTVEIAAIDANGLSTNVGPSTAFTTTGSTGSVALTWTAIPNAVSYNVWLTTGQYFNTTTASYTLTTATGTAGTPPTLNNSGGQELNTAIEVHGSNVVVSANTIRNFLTGIIYSADYTATGNEAAEHNVAITGNTMTVYQHGIQDDDATTQATTSGVKIANNAITLNLSTVPTFNADGSVAGINLYGNASQPLTDISIVSNQIKFEGDIVTSSVNPGWGCVDGLLLTTVISNIDISNNSCVDSPYSGIWYAAPAASINTGIKIDGNTIRDVGGWTAFNSAYRTGVFVDAFLTGTKWYGSEIANNVIVDDQATATMQQGIYWFGVTADNAPTQVKIVDNAIQYATAPPCCGGYLSLSESGPYFRQTWPNIYVPSQTFSSTAVTDQPPFGSTFYDPAIGKSFTITAQATTGVTWSGAGYKVLSVTPGGTSPTFPAITATTSVTTPSLIPGVLYSAAGTPLPSCVVGIQGETAVVKDATAPTYMGAYSSGGAITAAVICSYNGTTYAWLTH